MAIEVRRPGRAIRPWRPFEELAEMERNFEDIWGGWRLPAIWRRFPAEKEWMPAIDVFEKDDKIVVKAELPGMKQEDIDVSIEGNTLTIKGEKKTEKEVKEDNYYRSEFSYGSFFRSIPIPSSVDPNKIEATYEDGVLEVSLPKMPEVQPKKVTVSKSKKAASK
ncbi:MAG: Hsp20/alpha crystallin family protein [Dehalococcoidales bacterium]|nr:Hsp20/alpha crystallin family protein [Dehalococcoidales bacterium]